MCMSSVLPLPVAIQKASLLRSCCVNGSTRLAAGTAFPDASSGGRDEGAPLIEGLHMLVQPTKQRLWVAEVPVEVDLGEQQGQVLEVLGIEVRPRMVAPLGDAPPVADDVLVVGQAAGPAAAPAGRKAAAGSDESG